MRILLWHGYLLGGTGSNVYTRQLARAWTQAGHDVTVFSQDPRPDAYDPCGARVVRPDAGRLLPVFVLDRYEGYEVRLVQTCSLEELDRWVEANAARPTARPFARPHGGPWWTGGAGAALRAASWSRSGSDTDLRRGTMRQWVWRRAARPIPVFRLGDRPIT